MKKTLSILIALLFPATTFAAVPVTQPVNGGTGSTTLSGILLGNGTSPVRTTTIGSGLQLIGTTLSTTGGSSASSTILSDFNTWSGNNLFAGASTTVVRLSSAISTTTSLVLPNIPSALILTNSIGTASGYTGTTCTNQFVRSLSALGAATCATVSSSDVSLANLTAGDSSLTFSGTYNGSTARTIILNMSNSNTWIAGQIFANATSTNFFSTTASSTNLFSSSLGIASTTPFAALSVGSGNGSSTSSILVAENRPATSTSMTVNWLQGNQQLVRLGNAAMTISFSNYTDGQTLKVITCNPPTGTAGTITWGTQVLWTGGSAPTQTTTATHCDVFSFLATQGTSTLKIFGAQTSNF